MLVYATQTFTDSSGSYSAGNTYNLPESTANVQIQRGQMQLAETPPFYVSQMRNVGTPSNVNALSVSKNPAPYVLFQSAVPVNLTGTTTETALRNVVIPGGSPGINGTIRVSCKLSVTGSTNSKIINIKLANNILWTTTSTSATTLALNPFPISINNIGAVNSQIGSFFGASGTTSFPTSAVDTSVDQILSITGQLAVGSETITLQYFIVEILPGF